MTKMIAPVLSFTAEEIWQHIPGENEESVFLSDFPEADNAFIDSNLEQKWDVLWKIRDEVNKALEIKRQEKFIGNALEAKVTLFVDDDTRAILEANKSFLPSLFITSAAEGRSLLEAHEKVYKSTEMDNLSIFVERAEGEKCQRCWNWCVSVGSYEDHPELCHRCHKVVSA
jgi:isoleucyl-tRNA synthetase